MNKFFCIAILSIASILSLSAQDDKYKAVISNNNSVGVPAKIFFANETITFNRYDYYERMDRELNGFVYLHSTIMLLLKKANKIFPIIEPILKRKGVPSDLKYLAVIESSLDPRAYSSSKAAGLWQFLEGTGKDYGLEVNSEVDERYNIERSTEAACDYLKEAHEIYGSWSAAVLSYNAGKARITKELERQKTNNVLNLWLVEETTRYYYRMLAIKTIFENPQKYGFILSTRDLYKQINCKEITVDKEIPNLIDFAQSNGITYAELKDLNSWLRDDKLTNESHKKYKILIPKKESIYYNTPNKYVYDPRWVKSNNNKN